MGGGGEKVEVSGGGRGGAWAGGGRICTQTALHMATLDCLTFHANTLLYTCPLRAVVQGRRETLPRVLIVAPHLFTATIL